MRFRLRTLLIALAIAPPLLALVWLYPGAVSVALALVALLAVYLIVVPYCIAWFISAIAALIGKIPGQR